MKTRSASFAAVGNGRFCRQTGGSRSGLKHLLSGSFPGTENVTGDSVTVLIEVERWFDFVAKRFTVWAARMKAATWGGMDRAGHVALQNGAFFLAAGIRQRHSG